MTLLPLQASKSKQIFRTIIDIFNKGKSKFGHTKINMKILGDKFDEILWLE